MINIIKNLINNVRILRINLDEISFRNGCSHFQLMKSLYPNIKNLSEVYYKIYSQNGEDGIIDYLLFSLNIKTPKFIEIGIETYRECNTRFLFERTAPEGLVIDYLTDLEIHVKNTVQRLGNSKMHIN